MIPFFLIWGSFLNVVAYRIVRGLSIVAPRSYCPHCKNTIAWYDNIPVISFLFLRGKCRSCKQSISWLYPFIEIITVISLCMLFSLAPSKFHVGYFIFFSALIVTIRTDLEKMLISRYVTLFLIPLGWLLSATTLVSTHGLIPISFNESILGTIIGYLLLYVIAKIFYWGTGKEGMGQGDLELLAFIGSFTGPFGCWVTLLLSSTTGAIYGIACMAFSKQKSTIKIPFGPFLALGAMLFVLYQNFFIHFLLGR